MNRWTVLFVIALIAIPLVWYLATPHWAAYPEAARGADWRAIEPLSRGEGVLVHSYLGRNLTCGSEPLDFSQPGSGAYVEPIRREGYMEGSYLCWQVDDTYLYTREAARAELAPVDSFEKASDAANLFLSWIERTPSQETQNRSITVPGHPIGAAAVVDQGYVVRVREETGGCGSPHDVVESIYVVHRNASIEHLGMQEPAWLSRFSLRSRICID